MRGGGDKKMFFFVDVIFESPQRPFEDSMGDSKKKESTECDKGII